MLPKRIGILLLIGAFLGSPGTAFSESGAGAEVAPSPAAADPDTALYQKYLESIQSYSAPVRLQVLKRFLELHPENRHVPEVKEMISELERLVGPEALEEAAPKKPYSPAPGELKNLEPLPPAPAPKPAELTTETPVPGKTYSSGYTDGYKKGYQQGKKENKGFGAGVTTGILGTIIGEIVLILLLVAGAAS